MWTFVLFFTFFQHCTAKGISVSGYNDSDYGKTWMYIPDGDGLPKIADLTEFTEEQIEQMNFGVRSLADKIDFFLYTWENPSVPSILIWEEVQPEEFMAPFGDPFFNTSKDVKIIIHGWQSNGRKSMPLSIKNAYMGAKDCNVIIVDWGALADCTLYFPCFSNTKPVGKKTAELIDYLIQYYGMSLNQFHIIGHSLGAHAAGYAGSYLISGKVGRITGLDPAKPMFDSAPKYKRLDPTDARFVDIIHTSAGYLGFSDSLGTSDFYPNGGGTPQPGCFRTIITKPFDPCSHSRAYEYFVESILTGGFTSRRCNDEGDIGEDSCDGSLEVMGENTDTKNLGVFYLETNSEEPFSKY